jgi:hypothetical protein
MEIDIILPEPHAKQAAFLNSTAKRKIIRAGRRGGKTEGVAIGNIQKFLQLRRVLYAAPTSDQLGRWWSVVTRALAAPIAAGVFRKNETEHVIELAGTETRLRGKTAWNADSLRGDYADDLTLDEWQLMNEEAWELVGAPMLLDNNGDATFIYTPPSLHSRSVSKAGDPQHAAKMYKKIKGLMDAGNPRYYATTFTSHDNPYISKAALSEITSDMTNLAYRMEILAEDIDEAPGALWHRNKTQIGGVTICGIEDARTTTHPDLARVVVGVDPTASTAGDEAGIITCGVAGQDYYTLADDSCHGSPEQWAQRAITAFHRFRADCIVAEKNNGGEMVASVIKQAVINARLKDPNVGEVPVRLVWASRGKATRAEPISAIAESGRDHHVGTFPELEDELCLWVPGDESPNRLDAKVWAMSELSKYGTITALPDPFD